MLALAAALAFSPIVWLHYFALLLVAIAVVRPRLAPVWFIGLPLQLVITTGVYNGSTFQTAAMLGAAVLTFVLALAPPSGVAEDAAQASGRSTTVSSSPRWITRAPGSSRKSVVCDLRVSSTTTMRYPSAKLFQSSRRLAGVLLELVEELLVVELEAHVVRDAAAELGDLPEEPVGEAVGREHAILGPELRADRLDRLAWPVVLEPGLVSEEERAGDEEERGRQPGGDGDVQSPPRLALVLALELPADRDRDEHHAREREPDDPADGVHAARERERRGRRCRRSSGGDGRARRPRSRSRRGRRRTWC